MNEIAVESLGKIREIAKAKFLSGDFDAALNGYESCIELTDGSDLGAYFGAAYIYERGSSSKGADLEKALGYYLKSLAVDRLAQGSEGAASLAVARVLYKLGDRSRSEEAIRMCQESLGLRETAEAHIVFGLILENWSREPEQARENFLRAYEMRAPKAMRFYARSLMKSRRYLVGLLAHVWATVLWPYYTFRRAANLMWSTR